MYFSKYGIDKRSLTGKGNVKISDKNKRFKEELERKYEDTKCISSI